jgi:uncharacterized membrane protein YjgN (DUF898 family)
MSDNSINLTNQTEEIVEGHKLDFVGTTSELFPVVLKNLLFTILTFGIYRFWAKTNIRKYLWNKTRIDGEIFIYTGTGGELFLGALIVFFVFILPLFFALGYINLNYPTIAPFITLLLYPVFIFLIGVALYRAQVYRMSRTYFRGIRGAQMKGSLAYGWLALKYAILYFLTLGLTAPYIICKMWNFVMNNKRFGSGVFKSEVKSKPLFKIWIITYVATIVIFGGFFVIVIDAFTTQNVPVIIFSYLFLFIASAVIFAWFKTALYNHLLSSLKFQNVSFKFNLSPVKYILFSFKNTLIIIFTFGLGAPFVMQRWVRLFCEEIKIIGHVDFSTISQSPETGPEFGEGLVEAIDLG